MIKSSAIVKTDTEDNWNKAVNYIPDFNTIIVYIYDNDTPKIKLGDGVHTVTALPFLIHREVVDKTLII